MTRRRILSSLDLPSDSEIHFSASSSRQLLEVRSMRKKSVSSIAQFQQSSKKYLAENLRDDRVGESEPMLR